MSLVCLSPHRLFSVETFSLLKVGCLCIFQAHLLECFQLPALLFNLPRTRLRGGLRSNPAEAPKKTKEEKDKKPCVRKDAAQSDTPNPALVKERRKELEKRLHRQRD